MSLSRVSCDIRGELVEVILLDAINHRQIEDNMEPPTLLVLRELVQVTPVLDLYDDNAKSSPEG